MSSVQQLFCTVNRIPYRKRFAPFTEFRTATVTYRRRPASVTDLRTAIVPYWNRSMPLAETRKATGLYHSHSYREPASVPQAFRTVS